MAWVGWAGGGAAHCIKLSPPPPVAGWGLAEAMDCPPPLGSFRGGNGTLHRIEPAQYIGKDGGAAAPYPGPAYMRSVSVSPAGPFWGVM